MSQKASARQSKIDWARIDAMRDEDIDLSEIPELGDDFFEGAELVMPERKASITLRVDQNVLE